MGENKVDLTEVENFAKCVCVSSPTPLSIFEFLKDFRNLCGDSFKFERFGFSSAERCLESFSSLRTFKKEGKFFVEAKTNYQICDLQKLVQEQKKSHKVSDFDNVTRRRTTTNHRSHHRQSENVIDDYRRRDRSGRTKSMPNRQNENGRSFRYDKEEKLRNISINEKKYHSSSANKREHRNRRDSDLMNNINENEENETNMYFCFCVKPKDIIMKDCRALQINILFHDNLFQNNRLAAHTQIDRLVPQIETQMWLDGNSMRRSEKTKWLNNASVLLNDENYNMKEYIGLQKEFLN
ncbi:hypothetical protein SNEBB_004084 [Seison nebaliae]|nr:hypothetical protein SNEBB_004084 [Seison nebaliae]